MELNLIIDEYDLPAGLPLPCCVPACISRQVVQLQHQACWSRLPVEPRELRLACGLPSPIGRRCAADLGSRGPAQYCGSRRGSRKDRRRRCDRGLQSRRTTRERG